MKKLITLDTIMTAVIGAVGYGVGYAIPDKYGYSTLICFISCFALGMIVDEIVEKIVFSRFVQKSDKHRYFVFGGIIAIFIVALFVVQHLFDYSLLEELGEGLSETIIPPIAGFCFYYCVRYIKRTLILKKYGSGEGGFDIDQDAIKYLKTMMGVNKTHKEYTGDDPVAKAASGSYIGKKENDIVRFLGITYAKADRWKRAVQVNDSTEFFEAYYFGNSEIQPDSSHNVLTGFDQDEDCLSLNIWTSKLEPGSDKPVFVYFHGGDGRYGGSANPIFYLENLAAAKPDAVFISINYRFGLFGVIDFSSSDLPDKDEYPDSTALSLLDQVEALKWIRKNISAFGGDPENITVAGDGSGGSDIFLLSVMEEAKGLFKRAVILCASTIDTPEGNEEASLLGKKLIEEFQVQSVSELNNVTADQLKDFSVKYYDLIPLPPRNGKIVPEDVEKSYLNGAASGIEFIVGIADDDLSGWQAMVAGDVSLDAMAESYFELFKSKIGKEKHPQLEELVAKYKEPGCNDLDAKRSLLSDFQYKSCLLHDCRTLVKGGCSVRCFFWDVKGDVEKLTANSVSMVTAILGNMEIAEQMGYLHDKNLTEIMQALVEKYISGEAPQLYKNEIDGVAEIAWDKFDTDKEAVLHIQNKEIKVKRYPFSENVRELEKMFFEM